MIRLINKCGNLLLSIVCQDGKQIPSFLKSTEIINTMKSKVVSIMGCGRTA